MSDTPKLSICVPSRNRQACFQQTIRDLVASPRTDIEFVLADNSDDPRIMDGFIAAIDDPRVRYLPSVERTLSMMDNWERTVAASTGAWVCVIGDDDYVDPDVVDLIAAIEERDSKVDAIGWNRAAFQWGSARGEEKSVTLSMANRIIRSSHQAILDRLFGWLGATHVPQCPFGIYHGAVHRGTILRIKAQFANRCFEHPVVDYDFCHKLLASSNNLVYIDRPMSILGVSTESNSAAVGNAKASESAREAYLNENGDTFEVATVEGGFPFTQDTGVAGSIMAAQQWFKRKYDFRFPNWEGNFIRAIANECAIWRDRDDYDRYVAICRAAFQAWENGKYLKYFTPHYVERKPDGYFFGVNRRNLVINQDIGNATTPAEFYSIARQILPDAAEIAINL